MVSGLGQGSGVLPELLGVRNRAVWLVAPFAALRTYLD
jgi:hypothetical protein